MEGVPENLRKQLAVAVRSIKWSYAIFWSPSTRQQGVLEWNDGYYNGDIKTRKTVQDIELKADKVGLQRSEQLKELYKSLLEGETDAESKIPSAALSPEDLTDEEWYYLVCMSFTFNHGQGLPGRALAQDQSIWLCNADSADSKIFSRCLLAKSASIQTVVCFHHYGGVIELGVTELVLRDPTLIQHVKTSLLEFSKPVCSDKSSSPPDNEDDNDPKCPKFDNEIVDTVALEDLHFPTEDIKSDQAEFNEAAGNIDGDYSVVSPDDFSHTSEHNDQTEDSMLDGTNAGVSRDKSWHFMDDDFSNSSNSKSPDFPNKEMAIFTPKGGNVNNLDLEELKESNHTKLGSMDLGTNDNLHYRRTLCTLMRHSHLLIEGLCSKSCHCKSSFLSWKHGGKVDGHRPRQHQNMLKKILFSVPSMHSGCSLKSLEEKIGKDWLWKQEIDEISVQRTLPNKRTENEKFLVLKSMVSSTSKGDKVSILDHTIEYLKELEARIEACESCIDLVESKERTRRNYRDREQISDNYENGRTNHGMKPWINKRKACNIDGMDPELNRVVPKDGLPLDMKVRVYEHEVLIEMSCLAREYLLLDIVDAINELNLDIHSVHSSTLDGVLTLTLRSKVRGAAVASARMIKQALWKVAGKC